LSFIASPFPTRATYDAWLALPPDEAAAALEAAEREQAAAASSAATTAVLPGSFAWVSKDPRTGQLVPYDERSSRHLEIASRHLEEEATLLVNAEDAGFIVIITFDHEGGRHVQRSANGTGERPVRRTVDGTTVHFDGVSHSVPPDWTCRFRRVAWVHLDPVSGVVAPYSKENADNAERALRTRVTACGVHINLPNGTTLNAVLSIKLDGGEHSQSTFGGFREVRRLELPDGADSSEVDVYRLPPDDSIDSERYRFSRTENHTHTHSVPLSLGCYMEEEALPLTTFASLRDLEAGLSQISYPKEHLSGLARRLKTGPWVTACRALSDAFNSSDLTSNRPLTDHLRAIMRKWMDDGLMTTEHPHVIQPTDRLLDDLEGANARGYLVVTRTARSFGSNPLKIAAAAAYLLLNPDCIADPEPDPPAVHPEVAFNALRAAALADFPPQPPLPPSDAETAAAELPVATLGVAGAELAIPEVVMGDEA